MRHTAQYQITVRARHLNNLDCDCCDLSRTAMAKMRCTIELLVCLAAILCGASGEDKASYDKYRIYRVHIETMDHVNMLQELEQRSDSYMFIGHARHTNQNLTILVAAHKVGEMGDLLQLYNVTSQVLVKVARVACILFKWFLMLSTEL